MNQLLKRIFHKPDEEAVARIDDEIKENEKKRQELYRRLHAVEITIPVRKRLKSLKPVPKDTVRHQKTGGSHA